jgi:hypothetical protein
VTVEHEGREGRSASGAGADDVKRFQTVRPSLGDDGLLNLLLEEKVSS